MMEQIRGPQFDRIEHRHLAGEGARPLWFSIDSREGEQQPGDAAAASAISTNLGKMNNDGMRLLTGRGAAFMASRIGNYAAEPAAVSP